jgi:hypothetical protein
VIAPDARKAGDSTRMPCSASFHKALREGSWDRTLLVAPGYAVAGGMADHRLECPQMIYTDLDRSFCKAIQEGHVQGHQFSWRPREMTVARHAPRPATLVTADPLQAADRQGLAAMQLVVPDAEVPQPPALGLALPLRDRPEGVCSGHG